jgi:hypothetical protein
MFVYEKFKAVEGTGFQISDPQGNAIDATLISAELLRHPSHPEQRRDPFKLHFKGTKGIRLQQGNYQFNHPALEPSIIFIVPIAVDAETQEYTYEAIFN